MLVFHYRCHGNGSHIFEPKITKNVMKNQLFCIIISSTLEAPIGEIAKTLQPKNISWKQCVPQRL